MSPYVCDCTNVVYMFCVYCIYYYVNKFEARSSFSTSHLKLMVRHPGSTAVLLQLPVNELHQIDGFWKTMHKMNSHNNVQANVIDGVTLQDNIANH